MTLIAEDKAGFAMADFSAGQSDVGTFVAALGGIRGRFLDGGRPVPDATVMIHFIRIHSPERPMIQTTYLQTKTDAQGRFTFARVPPIRLRSESISAPGKMRVFDLVHTFR